MRRSVELTITAERHLKYLLTHLEVSWSTKVKLKFLDKFNSIIELIRINPELFPKSEIKSGLHKCVISK